MAISNSALSRIRWPPFGLGLGTPGNLASFSAEHRQGFKRTALVALLIGAATALLMLALDQFLFAGVSLQRIRAVGDSTFGQRVFIVLFSSVTEEIFYRVGVATVVAAAAFLAVRRFTSHAARLSMWLGVLVACLLFGLAHVGNLPNVPHPYLRAITLNGVAGLVLGWLYWFRGLESAVLAHFAANTVIYLIVASLLSGP